MDIYGISTTTQGYEEHWLRITGRVGDIVYYEQNHRTPDGEFWGLPNTRQIVVAMYLLIWRWVESHCRGSVGRNLAALPKGNE